MIGRHNNRIVFASNISGEKWRRLQQPRRTRTEVLADLAELDRLAAIGRADLIRSCHLDAIIGAFSTPNGAARRRLERELEKYDDAN